MLPGEGLVPQFPTCIVERARSLSPTTHKGQSWERTVCIGSGGGGRAVVVTFQWVL